MRFVRTILVFAIAASLALLPEGVSAAGFAMTSDDSHASMQMSSGTNMSMDDCCPDGMKGAPSQTDKYKCGMGLCCASGAISLGNVQAVAFERLAVTGSKMAVPPDQIVSFRGGSPPFRPPRV
jgi:hypothetical protein